MNIYKQVVIILFVLFNSCGQIKHEKFDSDKWKNSNLNLEENWSLRWDMMNDFKNIHKLEDMNKIQIDSLLGKPDEDSENEYLYNLGYSGIGINTGNLTLKFDKNNNIIKVQVRQG